MLSIVRTVQRTDHPSRIHRGINPLEFLGLATGPTSRIVKSGGSGTLLITLAAFVAPMGGHGLMVTCSMV